MPAPRVPVPDGPFTLLWHRLVQILQSNPTLGNAVQTWQVFDGTMTSVMDPATGMMPLIRLTPAARPATPNTPVSYTAGLGIQVDMAVEGLDVSNIFNLWWGFHRALWPGDGSNALLNAFQGSGVWPRTFDIALESPACSVHQDALDNMYLAATGMFTIDMLLPK